MTEMVLDASALARHLLASPDIATAFAAYDSERRQITAEIVLTNRRGGPERVIDLLEARAPDGFTDVDTVTTHAEREAIVRGYASMAGFSQDKVNTRV